MKKTNPKLTHRRNDAPVDIWSFVHLVTAMVLTLFFGPLFAIVVTFVWEPFETLVLSPILGKRYGILFGHETWRNSMSDIVFNTAGVVIAILIES